MVISWLRFLVGPLSIKIASVSHVGLQGDSPGQRKVHSLVAFCTTTTATTTALFRLHLTSVRNGNATIFYYIAYCCAKKINYKMSDLFVFCVDHFKNRNTVCIRVLDKLNFIEQLPQPSLKILLPSKVVKSDPENNHLITFTKVRSKSLIHTVEVVVDPLGHDYAATKRKMNSTVGHLLKNYALFYWLTK